MDDCNEDKPLELAMDGMAQVESSVWLAVVVLACFPRCAIKTVAFPSLKEDHCRADLDVSHGLCSSRDIFNR